MFRYEEVTEGVVDLFLEVLENRFSFLQHLTFKLLFDTKKRVSKGRIVLASIETANEKVKFFSQNKIVVNGYDFILIIDKLAWENASATDRVRIIRHELCHAFEDDNGKCKIMGHEIEDFYVEVAENSLEPMWREHLADMVFAIYSQQKDMAEDARTHVVEEGEISE
jgi:hypothetical protein